jgi:hypothetical protein
MNHVFVPVRPAKTHQIIARQLLIHLMNSLDTGKWEPIQEAALRDDDENSLSADLTVFDKEEAARVCIEIYKQPFSENARQKRYEQLINYYPDLEEVFFVVYKSLLEYFDFDIQAWYRVGREGVGQAGSYSQSLQIDLDFRVKPS